MENALFYLMAVGVVALSVGVISAKNPVMAVLSLLGSFFCLATIYLLAGFEFMAAAQIMVYAGAIMVLFLFVIMLLNLGGDTRDKILDTDVIRNRGLAVPALVVSGLLATGLIAIGTLDLAPIDPSVNEKGLASPIALANVMFVDHSLAFMGAGMLLLVTTIAVLVLAKRQRGSATQARETIVPPTPPAPAAPEQTEEREPVLAGGDR